MRIDESAYRSLEISKILDIIRRYCRSDLGARRIASVEPAGGMDELTDRQELFRAVECYRDARGDLPWNSKLSSVERCLDEARASGILLGEELTRVRALLLGAGRMKDALNEARSEWPIFSLLTRDLRDFSHEEEALSVIDDDGRLQDRASDRLRRTRERMRAIRDQIRRKGTHLLNDASISGMLRERVLTLRNGRHAVLVRQDAISNFPGIVMDRSGSGNSVYMEPHSLVGPNNEYAACAEDEKEEERRILRKLTELVLSRAQAILDAERVLGQIDLFYALSEKTRRDGWHMPVLEDGARFSFRGAAHPLLGAAAVPIDISCGEEFRVLVVTGPNTGGKTVALKTAGVCASLGWLGFPIPAAEGSALGGIDDIYSDIGDEQSIEQNLSTFSAHISRITKILAEASQGSLILLDELGAGTDPDEGAALGIAILDALQSKNSLVLATTHHNPIKRYALTRPGVESASVEFDAVTLSPTYRMLVGIPGRSNALLIAERLGVPGDILRRAREALQGKEVSMEDIIGELQERRTAIEREGAMLEEMRLETARARAEYEAELADIAERRDRMLEDADRKAIGIVRNAETSAKSLIRTIEGASRKDASRKLGRAKKHFDMIKEQADHREDERTQHRSKPDERPLEPGDVVVVVGMTQAASCTLSEIRGDKAVVTAGAAKMEIPLKMLRRATGTERGMAKKLEKISSGGGIRFNGADGGPSVKISTPPSPLGVPASIMIRGMTLDEAMPMAERYLDRAYRAGFGEVTVIHGRGTGTLRREVHSLCKSLPYVASFRLGEATEGGIGITVVRFKK
ncbi:MAG: Smr/MutS family protein [Synergistaceae bacterium]|jgi:DNA mismatch repair protein MutS2|nr:Smr/MutS family protein [Synergistaceae bacterium]